jgi:hypothetical protein
LWVQDVSKKELTLHSMKIPISLYTDQSSGWPVSGEQILASYDDESIIVYQVIQTEYGLVCVIVPCVLKTLMDITA